MTGTCAAVTTPDTMWNFCPSLGASVLFTILFGLTTIAHIVQARMYRKGYCWVIIMSSIWQTLAFIFRNLSIRNPVSYGDYAAWFVLILVAPLWTNAFVYMVVGRIVWNFKAGAKIFGIKASLFGLIFVLLDIVAFVIQVYGAATATGNDKPQSEVLDALHIYMAGVGVQQFFIIVFGIFAVQLYFSIRREQSGRARSNAMYLLYAVFVALILISVRIIFRIAEYAQGLDSTVPNHEAYQYVLDSTAMLLALVVFNVMHPGRIMPGKEGDMPSWFRKRRNNKESTQKTFLPLTTQRS